MKHFLKAALFGVLWVALLPRVGLATPCSSNSDCTRGTSCNIYCDTLHNPPQCSQGGCESSADCCSWQSCNTNTLPHKCEDLGNPPPPPAPPIVPMGQRMMRTPSFWGGLPLFHIKTSPQAPTAVASPALTGGIDIDAKILPPPNPNPILVEQGLDKELPICRHTAHGDDRIDCQMDACKKFYRNTLLAVSGLNPALTIPTFVGRIPASAKCYVVPLEDYNDLILPLLLRCIHDPNKPNGQDLTSASFGSPSCLNPFSSSGMWGNGFVLVAGERGGATLDDFNNKVGTAWSFNTDDSVGVCINQGAMEQARGACEDNCCGRSVILPR